jgi:hypothetical protein
MKLSHIFLSILVLLCILGSARSFINPADQCSGVTDDSCIMCGGTACMNQWNASICAGTNVDPYGPLMWMGGSGGCVCYCPYSLVTDYFATQCAAKTCTDTCYGSQMRSNGHCDASTNGECRFEYTNCENGCDASGAKCASASPTQPIPAGNRPDCGDAYNYCDTANGENCANCPQDCGCDPDKSCSPSTSGADYMGCYRGQDRCKGVTCEGACVDEGGVGKVYSQGVCDQNGKCDYSSVTACPGICDPEGKACAQSVGSISGDIFITDFSYQNPQLIKRPLKNVYVDFNVYDSSGSPVSFYGNAPNAWTDGEGHFTLTNPTALAAGNKIDIMVGFQDKDGKIDIQPPQSQGYVVKYVVKGISVSDPSLANYQIDLADLGITGDQDADAYGKAYVNTMRAIEFKEKALGITPTIKENVHLFSSLRTSHLGEQYADPDSGMRISAGDSGFFDSNSPDNREFHEYCHHIEDEAKPVQYSRSGNDHGSYNSNSDSEWGMVEGWAEFCSLQMKKYYGLGNNGHYYYSGGVINFELNHKMDANPGKKFSEELAIAGIMLDLTDSASDYGGKDDDSVSLPLSTVWSAFSAQRDFGDKKGTRYPRSLYDFYSAIKTLAPSSSGIDAIFIAHNAFQDLNSNGKWDAGEPAGYSGKGSTYRSDLEPMEGTDVVFDVKDQNGDPFKQFIAHVDVRIDPPNDYLSYSYDIPVVDGKASVPILPEGYEGQITMTAVQAGSSQAASSPFSITASDSRTKLDSGTQFGTYQSTITTSSVSCTSDYQCKAFGAGSRCTGGECTGTPPGQSGGCCGSAFVLMFFAAGVLMCSKK